MKRGAAAFGALSILAGLAWPGHCHAQLRLRPSVSAKSNWTAPIPLEGLEAEIRDKVRRVVQSPTITTRAPAEQFPDSLYDWMLDHPDRVAKAWRRLGVPCLGISSKEAGRFSCSDGQGNDLNWQTVWRGAEGRIWYAEGQCRAAAHLPAIPVRAVAILHCAKHRDEMGNPVVTHYVDIFISTDSRAANLVAKLIGPAAPRLAEQGATQLLMFFSGMSRHLHENRDQAMNLLRS